MLRIEKLFIQGFKSFCDPTELHFDEEGITAVVGPNGCGKSNVADAISWVIGEQRAKALRGGKMEDVIFQGSRNRQQSGLAEVILTMIVRETFEIRGDAPITTPAPKEPQADNDSPPDSVPDVLSVIEDPEQSPVPSPNETTSPLVASVPHSESTGVGTAPLRTAARQKRPTTPAALPRVFAEGERITIGRRLYRTGESEYEINGRHCRLRDIQDLFAGTGLGAAHYAIIEQGRIGQVLSAKPLDRRALIEEAAGVSKFKMRQHSAQMKLEASKQNLARVNDILSEIERQQNSLRRQAGKARRFKKLQQEMRDLMRAIFVVDYRGTTEAIRDREGTITEISAREEIVGAERLRLEDEQLRLSLSAKEAEIQLNEIREIAGSVDVESERARQQISFLQGQIQSLAARNSQTEQERSSIQERQGFLEQESGRLRLELQSVEAEINSESLALTAEEESHRAQSQSDLSAEAELEDKRKLVYEGVTQLERWRQLSRQFSESLDRSIERLSGLTAEKERAAEQSQSAIVRHAELEVQQSELELRHREIEERLRELELLLSTQRNDRDHLQESINRQERDITAIVHRLQSLRELDQRRAYFSESVQAIVSEGQASNSFRILGTLADFVKVAPTDELLVEQALRDELQYLIVPTAEDAIRAISFLNQQGAGRATFLIPGPTDNGSREASDSAVKTQPLSTAHQSLGSLLGLKPDILDALNLAFPRLLNARIVESLSDPAAQDSGSVSITRQGEKIVPGALITGGSRAEQAAGILATKREIEELDADLHQKREEADQIIRLLEDSVLAVRRSEENLQHLDGELRETDKYLAVLREQLLQCQRERERTSTHIRVVEQEAAQALQERESFESRLTHAQAEMEKAEEERALADKAATLAQEAVTELRRRAEERAEILSRRRAEFAARTERRRGYLNDIRRLENEILNLRNRAGRLDFEETEIGETLSLSRQNFELAKEQLSLLNERRGKISLEFEERSNKLANIREQFEQVDQALRETRDSSTTIREQRALLEIELVKLTANLQYLTQTCHSELGEDISKVCEQLELSTPPEMPTSTVDPTISSESVINESSEEDEVDLTITSNDVRFWYIPTDFNLEVAKVRLIEINERIEALGPINMMALQELAEIEDRQSFLMTQKLDLEKAITDTQSAINEIRKRSKEQFVDAFNKINENFKQMFQELFGGGTGEMRLIDQSDLLESGIEIIAQPPGKRLQNVLLLSGGEKAMAALSLIMAIFRFRPSPFCLLDEVDAPLDKMNISRFSDKVLQMSNQTQFLIITHSKRTMEAARTLYGVTMEDPGVSKLISVKLT